MRELLTAIALMLVIEGVLYSLFPQPMKQVLLAMLRQPDDRLRIAGLGSIFIGVIGVWLLRSLM